MTGSATLTVIPVSYVATPTIPDLQVTWSNWSTGADDVEFTASITGGIDLKIVADDLVTVTPKLTLTKLPVTVSFGDGSNGAAVVSPANVTVGALATYGSVSGCGALSWCNGLVTGQIESSIQGQIPSVLAAQLAYSLNGSGTPFWVAVMKGIANQKVLPGLLTDPAGYTLPLDGASSPAGTVTSWSCTGVQSFASSLLTGTFSASNLCYVDCTPKTVAQACGALGCGTTTDGCGTPVTCPGSCPSSQVCNTSTNTCEYPAVCPVCPAGESCSISNGVGFCVKTKLCPVRTHLCNGICIEGVGTCP